MHTFSILQNNPYDLNSRPANSLDTPNFCLSKDNSRCKADSTSFVAATIAIADLCFLRRATELTVQSERAFQKQPHIFLNSKVKTKTTRPGKGGRRWYKDVGLGFRTPKTAIEGSYIGTFWETRRCEKSWGNRKRWHVWHGRTMGMRLWNCLAWGISALTLISHNRQEVPLRRHRLYPRPYPDRHRRLDQDAPNCHHPPRVPPLHPQVLPLREAPQEPRRPCFPRFPC